MSQGNGMNVWLWGPSMWQTLHGLAYITDSGAGAAGHACRDHLNAVLKSLTHLLPCESCRRSFTDFFAELGPVQGSAVEYVHGLHGRVNQKLNRQRIASVAEKFPEDQRPGLIEALESMEDTLFSQPSINAVHKRNAIGADAVLLRSAVTTVLLAIVMRMLQFYTQHEQHEREYNARLVALRSFLVSLAALAARVPGESQRVSWLCQRINQALLEGYDAPRLRQLVEDIKYAEVGATVKGVRRSGLMEAYVCYHGGCK